MKQITKNADLVAYCGLYCGVCGAYLRERCPGCVENTRAGWCKIRSCCNENKYKSCADCADYTDVDDCKKFNNTISKIFAFVFRSNRKACIQQIRNKGLKEHSEIMAGIKKQTLPR